MIFNFRILFFVTVLCLFGSEATSQASHGQVQEGLTIQSEILGQEVRYSIYLPFDYDTSNRLYPVVYLLHGYTDNDVGWIQFGEAHLIADEGIEKREIPPMVLVMPDAGLSWYIDNFDGSEKYESFFFDELIPHIESTYRIRVGRRYRGIAGLSMGGFGAITYALRHPDMFSATVGLSAAIYTQEEVVNMNDHRWESWFSVIYGQKLIGEKRITDHLLSYNPIYLVQSIDLDTIKHLRIYLDCGDDDFLYRGNSAFHVTLRNLDIDHEYRVRDGRHSWSYWRSGLLDGLKFIGDSFHLK